MKIQCAKCGQQYEVEESYIGQDVECECGHKWQVMQPKKQPTRKQVKRKIEPGCVFGIFILLAILFWAVYTGYSKYIYRDTPENRAFDYTILNEEKSPGSMYYKATVEIKMKGRLLPHPQDLYYLVKKIAGIRQSYYVYFRLPEYSQRQYFANTESAELGVFYVSCNGNVDSTNKDLVEISYGRDYYSKRFPDQSTIIAESAKAAEQSAKPEAEYVKFLLCKQLDLLLDFRLSPDFVKYGFGRGGKYYSWLTTCQDLQTRANRLPHAYFDIGVSAGEILQIGMDYAKSGGKETKYIKEILPEVMQKIGYEEYDRNKQAALYRENKKEIDELKKTLCIFLDELLKMKTEPDFFQYGFDKEGPYYNWYAKCKILEKELMQNKKIPFDLQVVPFKLISIGEEYFKSRGQDTTYINETLSPMKKHIDYTEH